MGDRAGKVGRWPVTVEVRIDRDAAGVYSYSMSSPDGVVSSLPSGKQGLVFNNERNGGLKKGFLITFRVHDATEQGITFLPDKNDALSAMKVVPNGSCPPFRKTWGQFKPIALQNNNSELVVENPNGHLQYFGFSLFFQNPDGGGPLCYDPIGDNQNGGSDLH